MARIGLRDGERTPRALAKGLSEVDWTRLRSDTLKSELQLACSWLRDGDFVAKFDATGVAMIVRDAAKLGQHDLITEHIEHTIDQKLSADQFTGQHVTMLVNAACKLSFREDLVCKLAKAVSTKAATGDLAHGHVFTILRAAVTFPATGVPLTSGTFLTLVKARIDKRAEKNSFVLDEITTITSAAAKLGRYAEPRFRGSGEGGSPEGNRW